MTEENNKKNYMGWVTLSMFVYITVISFEDPFYPYQEYGLFVLVLWIIMLLFYQLPYTLIATELGFAYSGKEAGGMSSWIRRGTGSDLLGYATGWMYWAQTIPYLIDCASSVVVSISWIILGDNSLGRRMSPMVFSLITFSIILLFLIFDNTVKNALDATSLWSGIAMVAMTIIFFAMIVWSLTHGGHIATKLTWDNIRPHLSLHYFSSASMLIFAMSGAELAAPYVSRLKKPQKGFPKAMWLLFFVTALMVILETLGLAVLFDAKHIPNDFKMNGDYYAFQLLGREAGMGNSLMLAYSIVCLVSLLAQIAALIDAASRFLASDTAVKYMPRLLLKKNKNNRPINSYIFTAATTLILILLGGTLPQINDFINWLLNINTIVSPYKTSVVFLCFLILRYNKKNFKKNEFVFIRNRKGALAVGWWCFLLTFICATMAFLPQNGQFGTAKWFDQLWMNIIVVLFLFGTGFILPLLRKLEVKWHLNRN
ncbi:Inner membrane transporter YcaM [Lactobacillus helveticus]|uniref:APC family permease n=1 Tax=Lactobacillus helveticus TaxID=1587 RepID=UPI001562E3AA|nr:APC family permease [Lactobacillus helveticus]NRN81362.1 Inner membrane transporter YcaM [Lactobacillus helveticus]NRO24882.1 Inner membrane transporter YcaM [Lactobacillus helveticus]